MKFFSLQFLDKKTENKFQTKKQEITLQLMKSNSAFLTFFQIILIIISAYENNWIHFTLQLFCLITILICLRLNYRSRLQNYFQNSIIVFVIIFNYYKSIDHLLNNSQSHHLYIDGYIYALITISLINQASFLQKSIIIISIYLMLQIFMPDLQLAMWNQIIQFTICITFYIIHLYKIEQIQRKDFIQQLKHRKAFQQVVSFTGIQLYLVSYIREKNSLLLTMDNNEENITGQHQQQFIMQIRNMKVLIKDQDTQTQCKSLEGIRQEATFNLEKILFYFMTCPEKLKEQTKCFSNNDQLIKLQGILDADNYNIQIANLFDEVPSVILLITQNKKDVFIDELKLRYKLYQQALETIEQTFSQNIKMSLVYFTALQKINKQKSQIKNQIIYQTIQSKIGKAYNDFQNLKDFFNLNTSFQRTVIQNFDLLNFLDRIVNEIKNYYSQSKKLNFQIFSKLRNSRVIQDQKQIKQLFLNLLYCITEHSQDVSIFLEDSSGFQTKSTFAKIRFEYKGMFFSKDALKGLPFINPSTISELRHNTQQAYQLNLPMAVVLVRKLGPTNKIYIKQSKNTINSLEFYIYKELVEDFHLMPLQSQHPLNYLITNTRSSVHGKHAAYFDLLSLSPRIQLDNFGEL